MLPNIIFKKLNKLAACITFVVILTTIGLAGCSSEVSQSQSSSQEQEPPASSVEQPIDQSAQQQPPNSSGQQPSGSPGQQPPGTTDMTAILNRAAEILGIASDDFIAAFNNAMPEGEAFGSGQQGQPPATPPSGQQGQEPPVPPSGQQGQPPAQPSGQQMSQSQFMIEVCERMAAELNISADDIAEAITQAETELQE